MKIGITGGIGSGKSYVCKRLALRGIEVYDCDSAAKRLMRSDVIQQQLTALQARQGSAHPFSARLRGECPCPGRHRSPRRFRRLQAERHAMDGVCHYV